MIFFGAKTLCCTSPFDCSRTTAKPVAMINDGKALWMHFTMWIERIRFVFFFYKTERSNFNSFIYSEDGIWWILWLELKNCFWVKMLPTAWSVYDFLLFVLSLMLFCFFSSFIFFSSSPSCANFVWRSEILSHVKCRK